MAAGSDVMVAGVDIYADLKRHGAEASLPSGVKELGLCWTKSRSPQPSPAAAKA